DSRSREVERGRRAQPARTDTQDTRGFDTALPRRLQLGQEKMTGIAGQIVGVQGDLGKAFLVDNALAHTFKIARTTNRCPRFALLRNALTISRRPSTLPLSLYRN